MITWKFENSPITFKSTEVNLNRDISKMAHANKLDPSTKIIIIDGTISNPAVAISDSSVSNSCPTAQSTLPKRTKTPTVPEPEAVQLPTVSGDVDDVNPESDLLGSSDNAEHSDSSVDWSNS
jgi:hypothetical protein